MKVLPTMEGGLCILPESDADWMQLELICSDAVDASHLAESFADLMDDDSDWGEYVVPDLEKAFNRQCRFVAASIENAVDNNEQGVFIKPKHAEMWYGATNQARLSLEARYKLNALEELQDLGGIEQEVRSAYFRNRFYLFLQSMLLDFVMESCG